MLLMPPGKGSRDQRDQRCSGPRYIYKTVVNVSILTGHFTLYRKALLTRNYYWTSEAEQETTGLRCGLVAIDRHFSRAIPFLRAEC